MMEADEIVFRAIAILQPAIQLVARISEFRVERSVGR
jgi:hypothetical protein